MSTITDTVFMVRPANFGYNSETAENNAFQDNSGRMTVEEIKEAAKDEFDAFVQILQSKGIEVIVYEDSVLPVKTDAVFPNNWVTMHENGVLITYPMFSENRRLERSQEVIDDLKSRFGYSKQYYFDHYEADSKFLEGTGSMILDRDNKIVYACLSERTHVELLEKFAVVMSYKKVFFHAVDKNGDPIYHTNVMMALGENFCVVCLDAILDESERKEFVAEMDKTAKDIIEISQDQLNSFAGNMLQLKAENGDRFLIMSEQAFRSLEETQIMAIESHCEIVHAPLYTIEKYGGGSARCMITEVFY